VVKDRPVIRGLLEIDVTEARRRIRKHREATGEQLSFTAFLATCAGKVIDARKDVQACRDWRGRLVLFDEVDISTMIEVQRDGGITVGGIAEKPGVVDGRVEPREFLHVTLDFDHDVVDGAPAARFAQRFSELVEAGYGVPPVSSE
jgi:pyruvate/2-oxoglutarate dehydrogenase complex dihydrolipoamide acyltransferase (E2) component